MPEYLISFGRGAMGHISEEELPEVGRPAAAVCKEAEEAGVYVFADGLQYDGDGVEHAVVGIDGSVTDGPYAEGKELIGGMLIVSVPTRADALGWAAKVAAACQRAQDVRKFG
ncbi:hypothetical protein GCM10009554_44440 [Kribbella koreensis]|uniref:YCII-related domain-containing protein n=1 Tax=Kribbella koreensis TaxID=57909 RepID=A0ABN1QUK4_9ACTN